MVRILSKLVPAALRGVDIEHSLLLLGSGTQAVFYDSVGRTSGLGTGTEKDMACIPNGTLLTNPCSAQK